MRTDHPGGPIRWRMHFPLPPERVSAALDSDQGRAAFRAEPAVETDAGIAFRFINGYRCTSKVLTRNAPREWAFDYLGGVARFGLMADERGGTDLLPTHAGIGADD